MVNGSHSSPMGYRARGFAERLGEEYETAIFYRASNKLRAVAEFLVGLTRFGPTICYVLDMSFSGVLAGISYKTVSGCQLVIDTGDAIVELGRSMGRGRLGMYATSCIETAGLRFADRIVVRGSFHRELLAKKSVRADVIQDAFESDKVKPLDASDLRAKYQLQDKLTVGLLGSMVWSERLQMCYGWDLIETLRLLKDRPVVGVFIGDGTGLPVLQARAKEYGIEEKALFLGRVPYEELTKYLCLMDVCLSTQTNDAVGWVRTTGKLPLFLATGRYVLASKVGEAAYVLDQEMLVEYEGQRDEDYPRKLAERIENLLQHPEQLVCQDRLVELAHRQFSYTAQTEKLRRVLQDMIAP